METLTNSMNIPETQGLETAKRSFSDRVAGMSWDELFFSVNPITALPYNALGMLTRTGFYREEGLGSQGAMLKELEKNGYGNSVLHPQTGMGSGDENAEIHRVQKYAEEFTTAAKDIDQAIAELETGAAERIGRMLNAAELEALQPKIDEMRMQFQLAEDLRAGEVTELFKAQQAETDLLDIQSNGAKWQLDFYKALNDLKKKGVELTEDETAALLKQILARNSMQQAADFRKYLTGQAGNLRQTMLSSLGYDLQASVDGALRQAAQAAGGMLTAEQSNTVTRLAELEYRMTQQPALRMLGSEIQTNDLTRRGGMSTGAVLPKIETTIQGILSEQQRTSEDTAEMLRLLEELAG